MMERLKASCRSRLGLPPPWIRRHLAGRELVVRYGTIRDLPEPDEAWLLSLALHSRIVVDVGANVGQAALIVLLADTAQELVLVEPNAEALASAAENLLRNGLAGRVRFVCAAATDIRDSKVTLWTAGTMAAGSIYRAQAQTASRLGRHFDVPTVTVDSLCRDYALDPDLVKVDVEGAEGRVLVGSVELAKRRRTRFLIEMHSNAELSMSVNMRHVLRWCETLGYKAWLPTRAAVLTDTAPTEGCVRFWLLLQPSEWSYPDWLQGVTASTSLEAVWRGARSPRGR
jgi:FkbM family methyltransferase